MLGFTTQTIPKIIPKQFTCIHNNNKLPIFASQI